MFIPISDIHCFHFGHKDKTDITNLARQ